MDFSPLNQSKLQELGLIEGQECRVKYKNKDYFNGETTLEISNAKVVFNGDQIVFTITDPYGMERFISEVEIL